MALNSTRLEINSNNISAPTSYYNLDIATGGTISDHIRLAGDNFIGIGFPAAMDGASMSIQASMDGSTWRDINGVSLTITADDVYNIAPGTVFGWPFIRFVSDATETSARVLTILVKEL